MEFILKPSHFFLQQITQLSDAAKKRIKEKLRLAKINPFRFKRIKGNNLFLFRIRFQENRKEKRVVYLVDKKYVKVLCILDRDKEYKDLKEYLKKIIHD